MGRKSVGHPVDVATGTVYSTREDISIPGKVDLVWARHYSTALLALDMSPTPLGSGWTTRYFATLTRDEDDFRYFAPEGYVETFSDPDGLVDKGGIVRNLGTFKELKRQGNEYIITQWDVETGAIQRFVFNAGNKGAVWPLASIEDVTGHGLDMIRDASGRLIGVRQRLEKRTLLIDYTSDNRIKTVSFPMPDDQRQVLARYEYDTSGRLCAAFDALNNADQYEYDANSRMTREFIKDGGIFYFRYDHKGRCTKTSGLDRYAEKSLHFLEAIRFTEVTDSYDHTFRYQYLPSGQIVREIDPLGGERKTDYDEHGRILTKTDATGAITRYAYDEYGNRASITDALGNTHAFAYNEQHLPVSMTDPLGQVWHRVYDSSNRLIATIDPLDHHWLIRYDAEGNVAEILNPLGARRRQQYTQGVLESVTDWLGNVTRFRLDIFGRVTERTGPLGETTRFRFDALGNPIEVILPDGAALHATYDSVGNLTNFIDGNGHSTRFRYGPCRRLLERVDPVGGVVRYAWGSEPERLEQVINQKGETYTFFRDEAGRIIRERSFDNAERHFKYDAEGYAIAYTNANGETISIQLDALHRVIGQALPDGEEVNYGFDPIGNLLTAVNADIAVSFERDPLGRITREVQGEHWVESRYDALGNLIRTATSFAHTVDYQLDANGYVSKLTTLGNKTLAFKRNAHGRETSRQMPGGIIMEQRYDDLGRLIEQRVGPGRLGNGDASVIPPQREIIRRHYTYDRNSLLTCIVDGRWGRVDYVYDPAERLLQAMREQGPSEAFLYDPADNISRIQSQDKETTDEILVYGQGNRLLQKGSTHYEYDAEGRRIKKIDAADSDKPKIWLYEWNALDCLKAITRPDGEVWRYKYDGLARRIEKAGPNKQWNYLWDGNVIIHELPSHDQAVAWITRRGTFSPLAKVHDSGLYPIIEDHLGTPREMMDISGKLVWTASLTAWGQDARNPRFRHQHDCPIRFQGQWFDEESGLHYNRFRYYDPTTASFISQDPIALAGGANLYSYVKNPMLWIDPFGLGATIDNNGFFAPSNEYGRGSGSGRVRIPYQGTRSRDFTLANREAGFSSTPEGYTWHHANYNPRTGYGDMQLVRTSAHETPHAGGVSAFVQSTGIKYDTPEAVQHVEEEGRLRGRPCE